MASKSGTDIHARFWFAAEIDRIRAVADPGGDAFTIEQAYDLRDALDEAIQQAEAAREARQDE